MEKLLINIENLYVYVIHDLINNCDGEDPKCISANSLEDACYQAYMNDAEVRREYCIHVDWDRHIYNESEIKEIVNKETMPEKEHIIEYLKDHCNIRIVKATDVYMNKDLTTHHLTRINMIPVDHLYVYAIHDLINHCEGDDPRCISACSLDEAYYLSYMYDVEVRLKYCIDTEQEKDRNLDKKNIINKKTIPEKEDIIEYLKYHSDLNMVKATYVHMNKEPMIKHCKN